MSDEAPRLAPALPETPCQTPKGDCLIASRPAGHVLQVLAPTSAAGMGARLSELTGGGASALRAAGPGVWYVVGDAPLTPGDIAQLEIRVGPEIRLVDQTHGRVRLELSGPGAARLLATGTAIDLSPRRLPIGAACETLFGSIGVHLTRTGAASFELLVGRSFALSLWEELTS